MAPANLAFWLPDCARLPTLQNLHLVQMNEPFPLLERILAASPQLRTLYLRSNTGFTSEQHHSLALALKGQARLTKLALRNSHLCTGVEALPCSYATEFLVHHTTLTHLDVSENALTSEDCDMLWKALQDKGTLTSLSLAACWPDGGCIVDATSPARLVSLTSLVRLDLSFNQFPASMAPVLMALATHPKLQHLSLHGVSMDDELVDVLAIVLEKNTTLTSLQLPAMQDDLYEPLVRAMQQNQSLRSLSVRYVEKQCSMMTVEDSRRRFPTYLALMDLIALNRAHWEERVRVLDEERFALMEGGMQAFLRRLGNIDPSRVPLDVARYAAQMALERNGREAGVLTLLEKSAQEKGLEALERLRLKRTQQKALEALERPRRMDAPG